LSFTADLIAKIEKETNILSFTADLIVPTGQKIKIINITADLIALIAFSLKRELLNKLIVLIILIL